MPVVPSRPILGSVQMANTKKQQGFIEEPVYANNNERSVFSRLSPNNRLIATAVNGHPYAGSTRRPTDNDSNFFTGSRFR
jgi:hypothetical protein